MHMCILNPLYLGHTGEISDPKSYVFASAKTRSDQQRPMSDNPLACNPNPSVDSLYRAFMSAIARSRSWQKYSPNGAAFNDPMQHERIDRPYSQTWVLTKVELNSAVDNC